MGTRGSFLGGKAAGAWSWPLTPSSAEVKEWVELYLHSPNTPSWRGAQLGGAQGLRYLRLVICICSLPLCTALDLFFLSSVSLPRLISILYNFKYV
jgi:hypothetical protein